VVICLVAGRSGQRPPDNVARIRGQRGRRQPLELGLGGGAANRLERAPALEARQQPRRDLRVFRVEFQRNLGEEGVAFAVLPVELRRVPGRERADPPIVVFASACEHASRRGWAPGSELDRAAVRKGSSEDRPRERNSEPNPAPTGAPVDLFVEGPTPDWSLPLPQQTAADGAIRRFVFDLDGLPPGAKPDGAALTFTAVSGENAIEVTAHLD